MAAQPPNDPVAFSVQHVKSPEDFKEWVAVEKAAFATLRMMDDWYAGITQEELLAFAAKANERLWEDDPSAHYLSAKLPSGKIIGIAKWNFFVDSGPQHPWPKEHPPNAKAEAINFFFGALDDARNEGLKGKKHALMATLAIHPEYQRIGLGGKLLEWGLAKCDEEGLECWIDASKKGKGLYLKKGWVENGTVEVNLEDWGGPKGDPVVVQCMLRQPQKVNGST